MAKRPLGVTILCILGWIGALFSILGGIALLGLGAFGVALGGIGGGILAGLGSILGILVLVLGIANAIVLWWLWQMKKQGWTWTMILQAVSLVIALVQSNWIGVIIPGIIVAYLWMNKKLFK